MSEIENAVAAGLGNASVPEAPPNDIVFLGMGSVADDLAANFTNAGLKVAHIDARGNVRQFGSAGVLNERRRLWDDAVAKASP